LKRRAERKLPGSQERSCHYGVEEKLVEAHVGFLCADSADQLDCLLGSEGIHLESQFTLPAKCKRRGNVFRTAGCFEEREEMRRQIQEKEKGKPENGGEE
jgi:hypothetical protein